MALMMSKHIFVQLMLCLVAVPLIRGIGNVAIPCFGDQYLPLFIDLDVKITPDVITAGSTINVTFHVRKSQDGDLEIPKDKDIMVGTIVAPATGVFDRADPSNSITNYKNICPDGKSTSMTTCPTGKEEFQVFLQDVTIPIDATGEKLLFIQLKDTEKDRVVACTHVTITVAPSLKKISVTVP